MTSAKSGPMGQRTLSSGFEGKANGVMKKGGLIMMTPKIKKMDALIVLGYCLAPPEGEVDLTVVHTGWGRISPVSAKRIIKS